MFVWRRVPMARGPVLMLLKGKNSSTSVFVSKLPIYGVKMYQKELYCLCILLNFLPELLSMFS